MHTYLCVMHFPWALLRPRYVGRRCFPFFSFNVFFTFVYLLFVCLFCQARYVHFGYGVMTLHTEYDQRNIETREMFVCVFKVRMMMRMKKNGIALKSIAQMHVWHSIVPSFVFILFLPFHSLCVKCDGPNESNMLKSYQ